MVDIIISNTSPLLYLHRIEAMDWLPKLCEEVWMPGQCSRSCRRGCGEATMFRIHNTTNGSW